MSTTRSAAKGFLAGAIGGALGTLMLNLVQKGSLEGTRALESGWRKPYTRQQEGLVEQFNQAHAHTAEVLAGSVGQRLSRSARKASIPVVEYGFGILCAGLYGALAESVPEVTAGFGTVYGATLFTGASEVVLPALGWVPSPAKRTPVQHLGGLMGNVVYGAVTEGTRRLVRKTL